MSFLDHPPRFLFLTGKGGVGKTALSCATALRLTDSGKKVPTTPPAFLATVAHELQERFGIHHVTIQLEHAGETPCAQAPASVL